MCSNRLRDWEWLDVWYWQAVGGYHDSHEILLLMFPFCASSMMMYSISMDANECVCMCEFFWLISQFFFRLNSADSLADFVFVLVGSFLLSFSNIKLDNMSIYKSLGPFPCFLIWNCCGAAAAAVLLCWWLCKFILFGNESLLLVLLSCYYWIGDACLFVVSILADST